MKIETPCGQIIQIKNSNGTIRAELEWNSNFGEEKSDAFTSAQKFVDSEVLRLSSPYIPFKTGMLIKSGALGTVIGSGEVQYIAPYSSYQYYKTAQSRSYDPQRGGMWFERMKADHKDAILRGAKKYAAK